MAGDDLVCVIYNSDEIRFCGSGVGFQAIARDLANGEGGVEDRVRGQGEGVQGRRDWATAGCDQGESAITW